MTLKTYWKNEFPKTFRLNLVQAHRYWLDGFVSFISVTFIFFLKILFFRMLLIYSCTEMDSIFLHKIKCTSESIHFTKIYYQCQYHGHYQHINVLENCSKYTPYTSCIQQTTMDFISKFPVALGFFFVCCEKAKEIRNVKNFEQCWGLVSLENLICWDGLENIRNQWTNLRYELVELTSFSV